ncbi:MAG TPA: HlyD family type I secretion periplasmic adaptor subunit, partial [Devosia sp.]|nr:HlyD family type I secretion periplasmic adaptor subunit [Devosia sp.]
ASQKQVLVERMEQLDAQIGAVEAQMASASAQIELIQQDLASKQPLLKQGLVTAPQVLSLQIQEADMNGQLGQYQSSLAEIGQKRGELQSQLLSLDAERADKVAADYDATRVALSNANEKLNVSEDILDRTVVTAPVSGKVVNSRFMSPGGVVMRGEPIMDIVPTQERLLIDARISVLDIDVVHAGMPATIHLNALATYSMPRLQGTVVSVSADRIVDSGTGQAYYLARVEVSPKSLAAIGKAVDLVPGMPAEVLIVTSERTMAQYLIQPLQDTFRRSFHEI